MIPTITQDRIEDERDSDGPSAEIAAHEPTQRTGVTERSYEMRPSTGWIEEHRIQVASLLFSLRTFAAAMLALYFSYFFD